MVSIACDTEYKDRQVMSEVKQDVLSYRIQRKLVM